MSRKDKIEAILEDAKGTKGVDLDAFRRELESEEDDTFINLLYEFMLRDRRS